jgi:hypothetical protein
MDAEIKAMNRFAKVDLDGCLKELSQRLRSDLAGMTSLEKNEYILFRSIEHLIRGSALDAATAATGIAHYRQKRTTRPAERLHSRPAIRAEPLRNGENALAFRQFR